MAASVSAPPTCDMMSVSDFAQANKQTLKDCVDLHASTNQMCNDATCNRCALCALCTAAKMQAHEPMLPVPIKYLYPVTSIAHVLNLGDFLVDIKGASKSDLIPTDEDVTRYVDYVLKLEAVTKLNQEGCVRT